MEDPNYVHNDITHNLESPREVVPRVLELVKPRSILDVGCGTGTWLKIFDEFGITDYVGIDGVPIDDQRLKIPVEKFMIRDLRKTFSLQRKFDLILSLEVAEHIAEEYADQYIESLVTHGDVILFSAAIPGQGGQHHVNEQWPAFWQKKFERHGFYYHDLIRPEIWNQKGVQWWYRQNIFLLKKEKPSPTPFPLDAIHPELFTRSLKNHEEMIASLHRGRQGIKVSSLIFVNSIRYKILSLFGHG